jgi:hypothetical protein
MQHHFRQWYKTVYSAEQHFAQKFRGRRTAWLSGRNSGDAMGAQALRKPAELSGFPSPLSSLKRNEK